MLACLQAISHVWVRVPPSFSLVQGQSPGSFADKHGIAVDKHWIVVLSLGLKSVIGECFWGVLKVPCS